MKGILALLGLCASLACAQVQAQDRAERLSLDGRALSVKDQIKGREGVQYSVAARPGQQLMIRLTSSNASAYINVEKDGVAEPLCQGAMTGNVCAVRSDSAAEYVVDVYLMRNAARRGERARYTLTIDPDGTSTTSERGVSAGARSRDADKEAAAAAVAACKSALALKSGVNAVFVLPVSHVPAAGGFEVFLNLKGEQWLCTTDSRGNVSRMDKR